MSLILSTAALLALRQGEAIEPRLMRFPTIHGDTVVFTYAGDLWVTRTQGGLARRLTSSPGPESRPHFSADGRTIAFTGTYEGPPNIYTIPVEGGEPKRLTFDIEGDICQGWTPDGKIAYTSSHGNFINRQPRLWTVETKGGLPQRTVIDEAGEVSFLPGGNAIVYNRINSWAFNWRRYRGGSQGVISTYDFATNKYTEFPHGREQSFFPMPVGDKVYYITDKVGGVQNLFRRNLDGSGETQLTKFTDNDVRTPSTDGKTIVFERDGLLYLYDIASGGITQPRVRIPSENLAARPYLRNLTTSIENLSLSPSGVRMVVEARGDLFSVPTKQGDTRNMTTSSGVRERYPEWSPDGKTIAYVSDATGNYEIYTRPQLGGDATKLTTDTPGTIESLRWSPDGKYLDFLRSDNTFWILEVATKKLTKVIDAPYGMSGSDWSADGSWLALTRGGKNLQNALYLYEVATGKLTQVDSGYYEDSDVAFDRTGRYLYLLSSREFGVRPARATQTNEAVPVPRIYVIPLAKDTPNPLTVTSDEEPETGPTPPQPTPQPAPPTPTPPTGTPPPSAQAPAGSRPPVPSGPPPAVKVDLEGMASRILPLTLPPGTYRNLVGSTNGVFYQVGPNLARYDLNAKASLTLLEGVGNVTFNYSRSKIAYAAPGYIGVVDARPGISTGQGRVDLSDVQAIVNPRDEWRQMFWEAWRFERDHYYDPNFRGQDWKAIGERYASYLKDVNSRSDLSYVLGLMLGELGTSHAYVQGGDMGNVGRPIPIGYLGVDYAVGEGGKVRMTRVYRGHSYDEAERGPLSEPGIEVKDGEYLLEIDGKPVDASVNPDSLLQGKVGEYVTLTVNTAPTTTGARKIRVRPVATEGELRYWGFVDDARAYVDKATGGRVGYVHVRDTGAQGTIDLYRGFFPQTDKDALVVDERWNGGGNLPNGFVELLARRALTSAQQRNLADFNDAYAVDGPKAMLINGYAGSGGDMFPWLFRQEKVGPLIGKRTWGGLVGISSEMTLIDGGSVTAPEFAIYDRETGEIIAENQGIDPSTDVDRRPDLVAAGRDPQLEAAVKYLLEQLEKSKPREPRKGIPQVGKPGRIGG